MSTTVVSSDENRRILEQAGVVDLLSRVSSAVRVTSAGVEVENEDRLRSEAIDRLVRAAVFAADDERDTARWLIGEAGRLLGIRPASIHELYLARGRGEAGGFTVPAMNVRAAAFDTGRALFAAARELEVGAMICEIARSEIGYTDQRPAEYVACMTAAAIKEGWSGPLFVQGDHFQVSAKKYAADPGSEVQAVRELIREAVHAGFYNIDVDTSTLVELSHRSLDAQQERNYRLSAGLTEFIRALEPDGVTVSVGGEIGEVGSENSTPEELRSYMAGYLREMKSRSGRAGRELKGLSKISVQSGTSHGGVVLADGSVAEVAIDFETLGTLAKIARDEYGLAGAVQHGASTLPPEAFGKFPQVETAEIHLATNFQNIFFQHESFPASLRERIYNHLRSAHADERKEGDSEEQFLYKTRKKALGVFKRELWEMEDEGRAAIRESLSEQFAFLFRRLAVDGTRGLVGRHVEPPDLPRSGPAALRIESARDDWDLSD